MIKYSLTEALGNRKINDGGVKYPDIEDARCVDDMLYPVLRPGFRMTAGQRVFTLGSCFARNIERRLTGYDVPTMGFLPDQSDPIAQRGNTVLNEYNPGTMAQRINASVAGQDADAQCVLPEGEGHADYFITGAIASTQDVVMERRRRIDQVYAQLMQSDLMIITLGMTECWFDRETDSYLNRAPGAEYMRSAKDKGARFELRTLDLQDCIDLLAPAFEGALNGGLKNIMLTVSPVPLQRSFSMHDAVIANSASKAVLRGAVDILQREIGGIDYFPSYEMVTLLRGDPYGDDNVHVRNDVVARVTDYMMKCYAA